MSLLAEEGTGLTNKECKDHILLLHFLLLMISSLWQIIYNEVVVEDTDIPKALINYVMANSIEILILGSASRSGLFK